MDISNIDSTIIPPVRTDPVAPVSTTATTPVATTNAAVATASIVEFSPLAQLLAATVIFQTRQGQAVQPTNAGTPTNGSTTSFQQLVDAANAFINAFNAFQNTINGSYATAFETTFDNALLAGIQQENNQSGSNPIQSFIDNLAQLGINFQGDINASNPNYFQFDLTALEQAYANSPEQTAALLNSTFQGMGTLEQQLMTALSTQTLDPNQMMQQAATNAMQANANAAPAGVAGAASPVTAAAAAAVAEAEAIAPAIAAMMTAASPAAPAATATTSIPSATPAINTGTSATPLPFDPVTAGPLIAQAVAAYRIVENITPQPANLLVPSPAIDTVPDVIETTRVEPIGPDTPKGPAPRAKQ